MAAVIKRRVIRRVGEVGTWLRVSLRDGVPSARNSRVRDATSRWRHRWRNSSASDAECHKVSTIDIDIYDQSVPIVSFTDR